MPQIKDMIGWMRKNKNAARAACLLVQFADVVCQTTTWNCQIWCSDDNVSPHSAFTCKAFAPFKRKYTTWTVALIPSKGLRVFCVHPYTLHLCSSLDCGRWWKVTSKMLTLRQFLVLVQTWERLITAFNSSRLNDVCHFHFSSSYALILFWCISRCYFRATFWIKAS